MEELDNLEWDEGRGISGQLPPQDGYESLTVAEGELIVFIVKARSQLKTPKMLLKMKFNAMK